MNNEIMARVIDDARVAVREETAWRAPSRPAVASYDDPHDHREKTGQLEAMLKNVADSYDAEVDAKVSTLTAILEPVMIVGMALMVAFLIAALLMPMLQMNELISVG